jgi:hypothetical protein
LRLLNGGPARREGAPVRGIHVRYVDVNVGAGRGPSLSGIGDHDDGVVDADFCMHETPRGVRIPADFDGVENVLENTMVSLAPSTIR